MKTTVVDIGGGDVNLYVKGQLVLHIGQVSDEETINLFLYPRGGDIMKSLISKGYPEDGCTHEILVARI